MVWRFDEWIDDKVGGWEEYKVVSTKIELWKIENANK